MLDESHKEQFTEERTGLPLAVTVSAVVSLIGR
jgi:hypothetical protein